MPVAESWPTKNLVATRPIVRQMLWLSLLFVLLAVFVSVEAVAQGTDAKKNIDSGTEHSGTDHGSMAELGSKLADPTSNVWALFTEFEWTNNRGDLSDDDYKSGWNMTFQPIMPFQLTTDIKLLTRPIVPIILSTPVSTSLKPDGTAEFDDKGGLGDISLPLMISPVPKKGQTITFGIGPTLQFPTHTQKEIGTKTWEAGPAFVVAHKTKKLTAGVLAQYWWSYSEYGNNSAGKDTPSTSHGSLLSFWFWTLPDAMSIGFNPTITYNDKATSGNKWNVPFGPTVTKMTKIGNMPVKFALGIEYAVVHQDDFGPEWRIKLNIIPVIKSLQKSPFF
jgi:hypothetical protein